MTTSLRRSIQEWQVRSGGVAISSRTLAASTTASPGRDEKAAEPSFDFERLERAVAGLVERKQALESENAELLTALRDRDQKIRGLELRILEMGQRREDAIKQLNELIAHVEGLEAQFGGRDR